MTARNAEEETVYTRILELLDLLERADGDEMSVNEHAHAVGQFHERFQVMLPTDGSEAVGALGNGCPLTLTGPERGGSDEDRPHILESRKLPPAVCRPL